MGDAFLLSVIAGSIATINIYLAFGTAIFLIIIFKFDEMTNEVEG